MFLFNNNKNNNNNHSVVNWQINESSYNEPSALLTEPGLMISLNFDGETEVCELDSSSLHLAC